MTDGPQTLLPIAALDEGEMAGMVVAGVDVVLCHVHGQFYALKNQCSHAQQRLSTGRLRGYELSCPLHGARFDVRSGACLGGPANRSVDTYPVTLAGGKVQVTLASPNAAPTPDQGLQW